jgi:hypothetical protein
MINRRNFIKLGLSAAAAFVMMKNPFRLFASNSEDEEWVLPEEGRISFASGDVFVNNTSVDVGDPVKEGDVVRTGADSEAEIEIRDYAIFHIKESSTVRVDNMFIKPRVDVKKGWFLAIIKRETQFEVGTPLVLAGVRGTVLFVNVLNDEEEYICDCNGKIDLEESGQVVKKIAAKYHMAYTLRRTSGELEIKRAKLLYHTDDDILKMSDRFSRETMVIRTKASQKTGSSY